MGQVAIEGTWDELAVRADEFRKYQRLTLLVPSSDKSGSVPNQSMLDALNEITERQSNRPHTSPDDTDRLVREARSGAMYGLEPDHSDQ